VSGIIKLSKTQLVSVWIITINSLAINIITMINDIKLKKNSNNNIKKSQMERILDSGVVKVAIYKNTAYWVVNNVMYKSRVDRDGNVMDNEAEQIDVFKLSDKEVDNLLVILDSIKK
jgi:hypothetical protein